MAKNSSAPDAIAFCVRCGNGMITRMVGDRPRRACPECGYVHFTYPKVGVGVLVVEAGKILLVQRKMEPERGKWSIPAGFLDQGEDPQETAVREAFEETGLNVTIEQLIDVYHNPPAQGGASIFILYQARQIGGALQAGDDADAAGFFAPNALPELAFESTQAALKLLAKHQ